VGPERRGVARPLAGTLRAVVAALRRETATVLTAPDVLERLRTGGSEGGNRTRACASSAILSGPKSAESDFG